MSMYYNGDQTLPVISDFVNFNPHLKAISILRFDVLGTNNPNICFNKAPSITADFIENKKDFISFCNLLGIFLNLTGEMIESDGGFFVWEFTGNKRISYSGISDDTISIFDNEIRFIRFFTTNPAGIVEPLYLQAECLKNEKNYDNLLFILSIIFDKIFIPNKDVTKGIIWDCQEKCV